MAFRCCTFILHMDTEISCIIFIYKILQFTICKPLLWMLLQDSDFTQPWLNFTVCTSFGLLSMTYVTWLFCPFLHTTQNIWKPDGSHKNITLLILTHVPVFSLFFCHSFFSLTIYGSERHYCLLDSSKKRNCFNICAFFPLLF